MDYATSTIQMSLETAFGYPFILFVFFTFLIFLFYTVLPTKNSEKFHL